MFSQKKKKINLNIKEFEFGDILNIEFKYVFIRFKN